MNLNIESNLENGDIIEIVGLPFPRHVGIYASGRGVVHNQKSCCVVLTSMAGFSGGRPVRVISRVTGSWFEQEQAVQRALSLIGQRYDLLKFNCEHAATRKRASLGAHNYSDSRPYVSWVYSASWRFVSDSS